MIEEVIRDYLLTFTDLTDILTGGIITFNQTGRSGISIEFTPGVYSGAYLLPTAMVKLRSSSARTDLRDLDANVVGMTGMVEIWFYDDGDNGYSEILEASELVYQLLSGKYVEGAGHLRWTNDIGNIRDSSLDNAAVIRSDFRLVNIKG